LVARHPFPTHWKIVIVVLPLPPGRHGAGEVDAFRQLPDVPAREIDVLSRLVLLGLLPAVVEADLPAFGAALDELQTRVGRLFAPAQGGLLGHQNLEAIARRMREAGLHGVGQSSWGPALYGFTDKVSEQEASLTAEIELLHTLGGGSVVWTQAATHGAVCTVDGTDVAMPQFS
jgi:beta-RFAP synthase